MTNLYAIVTNYFVCFLTGSIVNREIPLSRGMIQTEWFPYALFLSLTFIIFFNVNAYTIQKVGMIITSVFQKLSLIFPAILGFVIFGEEGSVSKYIAIGLAVMSIILINIKKSSDVDMAAQIKTYWYWPFVVLFGSGLIETLLFYVEQTGKVVNAGVDFVSILFFLAGCWGLLFMTLTNQFIKVKRNDLIAGVLIGVPNFFTIYLIIKGLEVGYDGSVLFPLNNVGVIVTVAIVGILFFKEKLSIINYLGLGMALVSVYLIS